jgi:hypothetical protein
MENLSEIGKHSWIGMSSINQIILDNLEKMELTRKSLIDSGKLNVRVTWMNGSVGFCHTEPLTPWINDYSNFTHVCPSGL